MACNMSDVEVSDKERLLADPDEDDDDDDGASGLSSDYETSSVVSSSDIDNTNTLSYSLAEATYQDYKNNAKFKAPAIRIRSKTSLGGNPSVRNRRKRSLSPKGANDEEKSRYVVEVETTNKKFKRMWRPGSGQFKYTTRHYNKYFQRDTDPFGRNMCGFRDIPSNRRRLDDYVLFDVGGFKKQSFRTHIWRLAELITCIIVGLIWWEAFCEAHPWKNFPLRLLLVGGFAYAAGFCVTYYAGLAMIWQDWYIKRNPQMFTPKDPNRDGNKSRRDDALRRLKAHATKHMQVAEEKNKRLQEGQQEETKKTNCFAFL